MKKVICIVCLILSLYLLLFSLNYSFAETLEGYFVDQQSYTGGAGAPGTVTGNMFAQSFVPTISHVAAVSNYVFYGNYSDTIVEIRPDDQGFPSNAILGSSTTVAALPPFGGTGIIFDPPISLIPGETYYIVFYAVAGAQQQVKPGAPQYYNYPNGQPYYKQTGGNWIVGLPPEFDPNVYSDYTFKEYFYGEDTVPIAEAGPNQRASANQTVILDSSGSYDPDGTIVNYQWNRLPDGTSLYSGPNSTCETKALGRAEELIQLTITDNLGATETDTMHIFWIRPEQNADINE